MRLSPALILGAMLCLIPSQAMSPDASALYAGSSAGSLSNLTGCVDTSVIVTAPFGLGADAWDVTLAGSLALCSRANGALDIYDVSNPGTPMLLDKFSSNSSILDVAVLGSYAFVAHWDHFSSDRGITVLDLSNPSDVQQVGANTLPKMPYDVELRDSLLLVADASFPGTVWIMNVATPTSPVVIGSYPTADAARSVIARDTLAYVALSGDGLAILDLSDPTQPSLVGSLGNLTTAYDVFLLDSIAYVANLASGVALVDVSDPTLPVLIGSYNTPGSAAEVEVVGTVAHIADTDSGYLLLDVSNPASILPILTLPSADRTLGLTVSNSRTFAAEDAALTVYWIDSMGICGDGGIGPCEECDDGNTLRGDGCGDCQVEDFVHLCANRSLSVFGSTGGADLVDSLLYVASGPAGVSIYNARYAGIPYRIGRYNTPGSARRIDVLGTLAAVADLAGGLRLHDVTDPTDPVSAGHFATSTDVLDVDLVDTLAFVVCPDAFLVIDVSPPDTPSLVAVLPLVSDGLEVVVVGGRALVAGGAAGLFVIDVSDPALPQVLDTFSSSGSVKDVELKGDTLYLACGTGGVESLQLLPSGSLQSISSLAGLNASAVARQGLYLYAADQSTNIRLYDVTNPVDWVFAGSLPDPSFTATSDLTVAGGRLYASVPGEVGVISFSIRGERWCGDGVLDSGEACDDSNFVAADGCDSCCELQAPVAVCGNGNVEFPETCDDGNLASGDGCDPLCKVEPAVCGDLVIEYPETCDDGNADPADGCDNQCNLVGVCNDGVVEWPEECEDGNRIGGDGCDANCQYEHTCGDGNLEPGEECDDGNTTPLDDCSANCRIENCLIGLPGDVNVNGSVTSADVINLVGYIFKGGEPPVPCIASGDVNCSGTLTSADIIRLIGYIFKSGEPPCDICHGSPLAVYCME